MVMFGVFMFNLICGIIPCDPNFGTPKISSEPFMEFGFRDGSSSRNKNEVPALVKVQQGKLQGYHMKSIGGRIIFAFEGIPYGRAKRWMSPTPREEWRGTYQATKRGSDCLQISAAKMLRVYGSEDCLFLNVFTPDLPSKGNNPGYPVIVYFHAGSFFMGSGSEHGPTYMLNEDVILVTVNYRLGVLGFLSTGDAEIPGNYGLKDQALAIEWVSQNIAQFGGDPSNINLWGYSAGAVSVHLHMISNKTRHLFTKGLSLGAGSALQHWGVIPKWRARKYANSMAKRFGCPTEKSDQLANCLRKQNPDFLAADQLNWIEWFPFPGVMVAPTVEPEHPDAFLTETPEEAYKRGHVAKKPLIIGTTSHEGMTAVLVMQLFFRWLPFRLNYRKALKSYLDYNYIAENPDEVTDKVLQHYLGDKSPMMGSAFEYAEMSTHRFFHFGVIKGLQAHSEIAPTYSYYFSFRKGRYSMGNLFGHRAADWAPGHAEDDYYFFNCSTQYPGFKESDPDYHLTKVMLNFLVNFVTTGEPSYYSETEGDMHVWEQIIPNNNSNIRMLQFDEEVKMIDYPSIKHLKFWQDLKLKDTVPWIPFT